MVTEASYHPKHTITRDSDSKSVWVNGEYNCLGRFTPTGFEIFRAMSPLEQEPVSESSNAIDIKMKNLNSVDWESFKTLMLTHHQIDLSEVQNPLIEVP